VTKTHYLPQTNYAENKVMQSGELIASLKNVPVSDLAEMDLAIHDVGQVPAELALLHLSTMIAGIAADVAEYRLNKLKSELGV
jgi:hypothetical protein